MLRDGTYWACACHIAVTPATGAIKVEKCTLAVDPGVVINPAQLKRQVEGGAMMGISIALLEEVMTDESGITQDDWNSYPILTMADIPEIKVELLSQSQGWANSAAAQRQPMRWPRRRLRRPSTTQPEKRCGDCR